MTGNCEICSVWENLLEHPWKPGVYVCFDCRIELLTQFEEPDDDPHLEERIKSREN